MSRQLSPELQVIQNEFVEALSNGLESAKSLVNALAVQAAALETYKEVWTTWQEEQFDFSELLPGAWSYRWVAGLVDFSDDVELLHKQATEHASYAAWMLMNVTEK